MKRRLRNIEEKLERRVGSSQRPRLVVVYNLITPREPQGEAAIAEYKTRDPEYAAREPEGFDIIYVVSETAKQLTEQILSGEGTQKSP